MYRSPEQGGVGALKLSSFFYAQRCAWLARAANNCCDNWRYDLHLMAPGNNVFLLRKSDIDKNIHPILYNIIEAYEALNYSFTKINGNYKSGVLFENGNFKINTDPVQLIDRNFFGRDRYRLNTVAIRTLTYKDCFDNNNVFKSLEAFNAMGIPLVPASWLRLHGVLISARNVLKKPDPVKNTLCKSINQLFRPGIKGSKRFRLIIEYSEAVDTRNLRTSITFSNLTHTVLPPNNFLMNCIGAWKFTFHSSDVKNFIFRFRNNSLPLANRIQNYIANVNPNCVFCRIRHIQIRESFFHCFWECHSMSQWRTTFFNLYFQDMTGNLDLQLFYWYGIADPDQTLLTHSAILAVWDVFRYVIFKLKTRNILPNFETINREFLFLLSSMCKVSTQLSAQMNNNPLFSRIGPALG
jgi:hypothetical protein